MVILLKQNSVEIRRRIKAAGIDVCPCASFKDACWLDYHPHIGGVHGLGYGDEIMSGKESIELFEREEKEIILCKNVREFIKMINDSIASRKYMEEYIKLTK